MAAQPSFSIVIPTFQRRESVCATVAALAKLRYAGVVEVIVVVDGSTDSTSAALREVRCPFPLRVIEQDNRGQAAARNRGASEARGEIILFLDDDMVVDPDCLDQHARSHAEGADAVTAEIPVDPSSPGDFVTEALTSAAAWERKPPISPFHVYSGHLSVSKEVFERVGGFDETMLADGYGAEDLDFGLRLVGAFDVRHNSAAIAWQRSLVSPREHMRRARKLARSDVRLIAKHPDVAAELLACRGSPSTGHGRIAFGASRLPFLPELGAWAAIWTAEMASSLGMKSSPGVKRLYFAARSTYYWSALRKEAGASAVEQWLGLARGA